MAIRKYIAQNRITGLKAPARAPDGTLVAHAVDTGAEIELDDDKARELGQCGAIKPKHPRAEA